MWKCASRERVCENILDVVSAENRFAGFRKIDKNMSSPIGHRV